MSDDDDEEWGGRTPAELLKATLRALKMNQVGLCRRTGLSTKHVNQIMQGAVGITPDMALLLERATGTAAITWMQAELNRRRIQGGQVVLREQITWAVAWALQEVGPMDGGQGDSAAAKVALAAAERLLSQLGIPVWDGLASGA